LTNQKQELPMAASSIDTSYQVLVHLVKQFQRRFLEIDQPETKIGCGGHVCYLILTK